MDQEKKFINIADQCLNDKELNFVGQNPGLGRSLGPQTMNPF